MKLVHQIASAPTVPDTNVRYGARIKTLVIEGRHVICYWVVYTRKTRNHKAADKAKVAS